MNRLMNRLVANRYRPVHRVVSQHAPTLHGVLFAAVACLCLAVRPLPVHAQDDDPTPVLPDIAPQVYEILGSLEISLPSLQRQPLMGFNPPPRVAAVPADRQPFVEPYKQKSEDLPPIPLASPVPPSIQSLVGGIPMDGTLEVSVGNYLTRAVRWRVEQPLSRPASFRRPLDTAHSGVQQAAPRTSFVSRLDYDGSRGHIPHEAPEGVLASFNIFEGLAGIQHVAEWATFGIELDGLLSGQPLYAASPGASFGSTLEAAPNRTSVGGGGNLWFATGASTGMDLDARLRYGITSHETKVADDDPTDRFSRREASLSTVARLDVPLSRGVALVADARYTQLKFDDDRTGSGVSMLDAAGGIRINQSRRFRLRGSARLLTFREESGSYSTWIAPDLRLDAYLGSSLHLYVLNDARAEHRSTTSMLGENPYLVDRPLIRPTLFNIDARTGGRIQIDRFALDMHVGYAQAPSYRYFESASESDAGGYSVGMTTVRYDEAEILYASSDASLSLPGAFNLTAGFSLRDGTLADDDRDIPYFGRFLGRGALSWSFLRGRGFVQATARYESTRSPHAERPTPSQDESSASDLEGWFDVDVQGSYWFTSNIGVLLRLENIGAEGTMRWEHYDQRPLVVSLGIGLRW